MSKLIVLVTKARSCIDKISSFLEDTIFKEYELKVFYSLDDIDNEYLENVHCLLICLDDEKVIPIDIIEKTKNRQVLIPTVYLFNVKNNIENLPVDLEELEILILNKSNSYTLEKSINCALKRTKFITEHIEQKELFDLAINSSEAGIWDWKLANADQVWISSELQNILGLQSKDYISVDSAKALFVDENLSELYLQVRNQQKNDSSIIVEYLLKRNNGTNFWASIKINTKRNAQNKITRVVGTVHDITKRRTAELKHKESEERFELAIKGANAGLWEWKIINNEVEEWWSPKYFEILGYQYNEIKPCKENLEKIVHPDDIDKLKESINNKLPYGKSYESKIRFITKDNSIKTLLCTGLSVEPKGNIKARMVGSVIDITEEISYQKKLSKSKERFKSLLNTSPTSAFIIQNNNVVYLNPVTEASIGYNIDQLNSKGLLSIIHPDDRINILKKSKEVLQSEKKAARLTARINTSYNTEIYSDITITQIEYNGEIAILGNGIDISLSKQYEKRLQEQKQFSESLLNNLPLEVVVLSKDLKYMFVNNTATNNKETRDWIIGKTDLELAETNIISINSALDRQQKIESAIAAKKEISWLEKQVKNGQTKYLYRTYYPIFENNKLKYTIGYGFDISKQKVAENKLRKRADFEQLIIGLSNRLVNIHYDQLDVFISYALAKIGKFIGVDKAFLYQIDEVSQFMKNTHCWSSKQKNCKDLNKNTTLISKTNWWFEQLKNEEKITIHNIDDIPASAQADKYNFSSDEAKSMLLIPLKTNRNIIGFISFETCKTHRIWEQDLISILKISTQVFLNSIEREKSQGALIANEQKFRTLTENAHAAIFISQNLRFVYANNSTVELCGYSLDELLSMSILDIYHPDEWNSSELNASELKLGNKEVSRSERKILHKSGDVKYIDITSNIIEYNNRKALISIAIDISEKKKVEQEKSVLIDRLTQQNRDLEQFSYITSHNLRSPIAGIKGLIGLIDKSSFKNQQDEDIINRIVLAANNLDLTIQELNEVTSLKTKLNDKYQNINLYDLFMLIIDNHEGIINESGAKIIMNIQQNFNIFTSKSYLESILTNLLTNAIKYRNVNKALIIEISLKNYNNDVRISVKDNGLGLDLKRYSNKLFKFKQRFHLDIEGRGLGLYLVKTQVTALNGSVSVESTINEGSIFHITLPK